MLVNKRITKNLNLDLFNANHFKLGLTQTYEIVSKNFGGSLRKNVILGVVVVRMSPKIF